MALVLVISFALNMIQANEKGLRCKRSNYEETGCSIFVAKEKKN